MRKRFYLALHWKWWKLVENVLTYVSNHSAAKLKLSTVHLSLRLTMTFLGTVSVPWQSNVSRWRSDQSIVFKADSSKNNPLLDCEWASRLWETKSREIEVSLLFLAFNDMRKHPSLSLHPEAEIFFDMHPFCEILSWHEVDDWKCYLRFAGAPGRWQRFMCTPMCASCV